MSYYLNENGESPLCLAIRTGDKEILEPLFDDLGVYDGLVGRPKEESPVYAAILSRKLGTILAPNFINFSFHSI